MSLQFIVDGVVAGAVIGLGAIGVTLTYSILRFANFAHGEFISWGAYLTLSVAGLLGALAGGSGTPIAPFSFTWTVLLAGLIGMALTGALALALDQLLFRHLRERGEGIVAIMASFGASLALRSLLEVYLLVAAGLFHPRPADRQTPRRGPQGDPEPARQRGRHRRARRCHAPAIDPDQDRPGHASRQREP